MRVAALLLLAAWVSASTAAGAAHPPPTVPCGEIIGRSASPTSGGNRVVLGVVSVPPAYVTQTVESGHPTWRYWSKWGLLVQAGGSAPVRIAVPRAWRSRVAFAWGNSIGIVQDLRVARCRSAAGKRWNAYAGGFYLRSRTDCVPLTFHVGTRSRTVWFGVGRRCT